MSRRYEALLDEPPRCATDDGSFGREGFCTSLVESARGSCEQGSRTAIWPCAAPRPMKIVAGMAAEAGVPCEVSMEKRMACGVGACLSCVVDGGRQEAGPASTARVRCAEGGMVDENRRIDPGATGGGSLSRSAVLLARRPPGCRLVRNSLGGGFLAGLFLLR
ncbi:MAG: hypothetical protein ACLTMP_07645 [Eggerthella lenta]